ncbi:MAG: hypothetical protein JSS12_04645 [Verrucomicrobia bacterium]|nr:hypothetical protein [Verrucomicrobiota bacterium]
MCKVQNELRFFLNEFLPVSYADSKPLDLAPKPISAQLFSGISSCLTSVNQKWQGRAVRPLANAAFTIGYALNTVVALVEFVASLALATLLTQLYKSTGLLKNQTIKALGYSLHSAAIAATQVACMILGHPFLRSLYSVVSNGSHIASLTFANYFVDQEAFDQIFADSIHTFIEKGALVELLCALDRDFGVGGTNEQLQEMLSKQSLIGFVYSHEDVTNLFAEFELSDLFDPEMRALFKTIAEEFVQYSYNPVQVDFNEDVDYGDNQMDPYRKKLVEYVETACRDLKGKLEGIEDFDPSMHELQLFL